MAQIQINFLRLIRFIMHSEDLHVASFPDFFNNIGFTVCDSGETIPKETIFTTIKVLPCFSSIAFH